LRKVGHCCRQSPSGGGKAPNGRSEIRALMTERTDANKVGGAVRLGILKDQVGNDVREGGCGCRGERIAASSERCGGGKMHLAALFFEKLSGR